MNRVTKEFVNMEMIYAVRNQFFPFFYSDGTVYGRYWWVSWISNLLTLLCTVWISWRTSLSKLVGYPMLDQVMLLVQIVIVLLIWGVLLWIHHKLRWKIYDFPGKHGLLAKLYNSMSILFMYLWIMCTTVLVKLLSML